MHADKAKTMMRRIGVNLVMLLFFLPCSAARAEEILPTPDDNIVMVPVVVDGIALFRVRGLSTYPAEKRAADVARAIREAAQDRAIDPSKVSLTNQGSRVDVFCDTRKIFSVVASEAHQEKISLENYSLVVQRAIMDAITRYRHDRSLVVLRTRIIEAMGMIAVAVLLFIVWYRISKALNRFLDRRISSHVKDLQIQTLQIVRRQHIWRSIQFIVNFTECFASAIVLYILAFEVLDLFPWTREVSQSLLNHLMDPLKVIFMGIVGHLPSLIFIAILLITVRFVLRLCKAGFQSIGNGQMHFAGFEPEWAMPTYRLVRLLIITFTIVVAYPYIPGSSSDAFKACSLFLGLLFSIGSSSMLGNVMAGYSMTYRRAFRVGDIIKTGDHVGEVLETRLMATRLRTLKNEEVIIPNSKLIGEEVLNYSSLRAKHGLILNTRVGIGYEVSWRQVEAMLLEAAGKSQGCRPEEAFVLIKELGTFTVIYELNVPCAEPSIMPQLYTGLHKNILDAFNKYGVQIMTPAYEGDAPNAKVVPPEAWYKAPALPPSSSEKSVIP
jgi:small-conductance mechanosensitive channel